MHPYIVLLSLFIIIIPTSSLGSESANDFRIIETPLTILKANRVFGWHVVNTRDTGHRSISSDPATMNWHHELSVLAHAKAVSSDKIDSIRRRSATQTNSSFSLLARRPSNYYQAVQYQRDIAILPEVALIGYHPSVKASIAITPTDTCYKSQTELSDDLRYKHAVRLPEAWGLSQGSSNIAIGILDTGIVTHTDLDYNRISIDGEAIQDFVSSPGQSADGDDSTESDSRDTDPTDPGFSSDCGGYSGYHGTHVTGTLAASSNNNKGITGVNWFSKIIPLRVLGPNDGSTGDIVDAVQWIQNKPEVKVLNMSFGLAGFSCEQAFPNSPDFISQAYDKGILSFVASGNKNADAADFSPANCESAIAVAAVNNYGRKAYYSNYGPEIDISAPGGVDDRYNLSSSRGFGILSTVNSNLYEYKHGTSMATPITAGIASLVFSHNTILSANEVKNILLATATPFFNANDGEQGIKCNTEICGAGIVNAHQALVHAEPSYPPEVFFLRQTRHALLDQSVDLEILVSKKSSSDAPLIIKASSDSSCTLLQTEYRATIPAGSLKHTLTVQARTASQEEKCHNMTLELQLQPNSGADVGVSKDKSQNTISFINPDDLQLTSAFTDIEHWSYLPPDSPQGNVHSALITSDVEYYVSTISSMNTEIIIRDKLDDDHYTVLYDSTTEDRSDDNKLDYWLSYRTLRARKIDITVRERSDNGAGGIYALILTTKPDLSGEFSATCSVDLKTTRGQCISPQATDQDDGKVAVRYSSSSFSPYFLVILMILLGSQAAFFPVSERRLSRFASLLLTR